MNTNMTGFRWSQESLRSCAFDESSLRMGRVKVQGERQDLPVDWCREGSRDCSVARPVQRR